MTNQKQLSLLSVRVTDEFKSQVDEEAKARRLNVSEFIRKAIALALDPTVKTSVPPR